MKSFNFANVYGFIKSSSKVILFLNVFLCIIAFFSCDSTVVKFELLENVCDTVFISVCSVHGFPEL